MTKAAELDELLEKIQDDDDFPYSVDYYDLDSRNPFQWRILLEGPNDTPYQGGFFVAKIIFPNDYPKNPPKIYFRTKIYHLNVDPENGAVCFGSYDGNSILERIDYLFTYFMNQNPNSVYGLERAEMFKNNRSEFDRIAREWTRDFATMEKCNEITFPKFPN